MLYLLRLSRTLFYLALALHLGGLITLGAIVAPALAQTVRDDHITYPALPPALDMDRQTIGQLFGPALSRFQYVELACAALMVIALALETMWQRRPAAGRTGVSPIPLSLKLRSLLTLLLLALLAYDFFALTPNVWHTRDLWRTAAATNPTAATGPLADQFNSLHKTSELLGHLKSYTLLALLLLTTWSTTQSAVPKLAD